MPEIPPWLTRDYDPVGSYIKSFQIGAQIGEAQTRIAEQQRQANMEHAAKQEAMQANILKAQQEMLMEKAYKDQQLSLENARLEETKNRNMQLAVQAARTFAERQDQFDIKTGMEREKIINTENWRRAQLEKPPTVSMADRNTQRLMDYANRIDQAEKAGNKELADKILEEAEVFESQIKGPPDTKMQFGPTGTLESYSTGVDRPSILDRFRKNRPNQPTTVATATRTQKLLQSWEAATELMNDLKSRISTWDVGGAGVLGEFVWDRGLMQLLEKVGGAAATKPGEIAPSRMKNRTAMVMLRESLVHNIDPDNRMSNVDRARVEAALPSTGVFESKKALTDRLDEVTRILRRYAKVYSESAGLTTPLWALPPEEIRRLRKEDKISYEKAVEILQRFH